MPRVANVGESAPDFELPGTSGSFRLSDHRGERVILLFYPGDNTVKPNRGAGASLMAG